MYAGSRPPAGTWPSWQSDVSGFYCERSQTLQTGGNTNPYGKLQPIGGSKLDNYRVIQRVEESVRSKVDLTWLDFCYWSARWNTPAEANQMNAPAWGYAWELVVSNCAWWSG